MRTSRMRSERHRRLAAARVRRFGARFVAAVILASAAAIPAHAQAPSVGTVYAVRKPITDTVTYVGRIDAVNRVEISARVQGYLEAVLFKEGDAVKIGDPLYRIEKGPFEAAVQQAQAALDRSKADKLLSEIQLSRAELLLSQNSGPASTRDQARATDEENKAAILSNQASLEIAKINLNYTDIVSPIAGKISRTNITVGNVVGPNSGALTLIVSQDPMYVSFPVSQRALLQVQTADHRTDAKDIKVKVRFADGTTYNQVGAIDFVDVSVNRMTDTVLVRAVMPNPAGILIDGELVNVALEAGKPEEKVIVPQAALIADQEGIYVFAVEDGKAVVKRVKVGGEDGANVVLDGGLKGGEQIIVQGIQSVRPGQPVQASPLPASLSRS